MEIKHVGDRAVTSRTRGYALSYKGVKQHYARAATQVKDPIEWERLFLAEGIETYTGSHLATMREIMDGTHPDLISTPLKRKVNLDWDFKRIPLRDGSGCTRPPETVQEVYATRDIADSMRKRGQRATPERVLLVSTGIRTQGGTSEAIRRTIHQAVAHDLGGWRPRGPKDDAIARRLDIPLSRFKNYKRRKPCPQSLMASAETLAVLEDVAQRLGLAVTPAMRGVLIAPESGTQWPVARPARPSTWTEPAEWDEDIVIDPDDSIIDPEDIGIDPEDMIFEPEVLTEAEIAEWEREELEWCSVKD
jgi:hypothetical protein